MAGEKTCYDERTGGGDSEPPGGGGAEPQRTEELAEDEEDGGGGGEVGSHQLILDHLADRYIWDGVRTFAVLKCSVRFRFPQQLYCLFTGNLTMVLNNFIEMMMPMTNNDDY